MFVTVTGGSGSGKSAFAEEQILKFPEKNRLYIATMVCFDEESRQRVKRHRKMRKEKHFDTLECPTDLVHVRIPKDTAVLLECMSNLAANEVFSPEGAKEHAYEAFCHGILNIKSRRQMSALSRMRFFQMVWSMIKRRKIIRGCSEGSMHIWRKFPMSAMK